MARSPRGRISNVVFVALVVLALVAAGCGGDANDPGGLRVVTTTTILGDVARNVVGTDGTVEVLLPLGADPHDYRASAQDVAAIQAADLVIANGLMLEEGLRDVLDSVADDGANILEIAELLHPLPFSNEDDGDPHVWFDPSRMGEAAHIIAGELAEIDAGTDWVNRAAAYAAELGAADDEIRSLLAAIAPEHRKLITNHDALGYFADRYDFAVVGTVIPGGSTLADPSSAALADLVDEIARQGVGAIFTETTEPSALAEAVAAESGREVEVVDLYTGSLGEAGSGADTLIGMLLTNAERIAAALA